ncbi:unnamed protein product [Prorocentrum cordatum]|uniref:Uncharacterized protein n=1 Tax=Prorocentrum cordatum TaxID=2364126 RepID=A0ABN9UDW0_9DINO|nr:unnamed protein product [Polarella glacialis]
MGGSRMAARREGAGTLEGNPFPGCPRASESLRGHRGDGRVLRGTRWQADAWLDVPAVSALALAARRRHGAFGSGRALVRCSRLQHARCSAAATGALRPGESTACTQGGSGRPRLWRGPPASTSAPCPLFFRVGRRGR